MNVSPITAAMLWCRNWSAVANRVWVINNSGHVVGSFSRQVHSWSWIRVRGCCSAHYCWCWHDACVCCVIIRYAFGAVHVTNIPVPIGIALSLGRDLQSAKRDSVVVLNTVYICICTQFWLHVVLVYWEPRGLLKYQLRKATQHKPIISRFPPQSRNFPCYDFTMRAAIPGSLPLWWRTLFADFISIRPLVISACKSMAVANENTHYICNVFSN